MRRILTAMVILITRCSIAVAGSRRSGISTTMFSLVGRTDQQLPVGWELVAVGDFNLDGKPDYVLYNSKHASNGDLVSE